jgi:hypothetical protein
MNYNINQLMKSQREIYNKLMYNANGDIIGSISNSVKYSKTSMFDTSQENSLNLLERFLNTFILSMIESKFEMDTIKHNIQYKLYDITPDELSHDFFQSNPYTVPEIIREIHNDVHHILQFSLYIPGKSKQIRICFLLDSEDGNIKNINKFMNYQDVAYQYIFYYLFLSKYSSKMCGESLTIYVYNSKKKKIIPVIRSRTNDKTTIISPKHANSAITTSCISDGIIFVYREEEQYKVVLHELFHILGLDFSQISQTQFKNIQSMLHEMFRISSEYRIYEGYTEFWATIMNICFDVFSQYSSHIDTLCNRSMDESYRLCREMSILKTGLIKEIKDNIQTRIEEEIIYSVFQMNKILDFMGLSYGVLVSNTKHDISLKEIKYRENTNVFAYYILKTILLFHYIDTIEWCRENGSNYIQFGNNIQDFIHLINTMYTKPNFMNFVSQNMEIYKNMKMGKHNDIKIGNIDMMNTMRMTFN